MQTSKAQFKPRALEYFRRVQETGEALIITDRGRPAIRIERYRALDRDPFHSLKGTVKRYDNPEAPVAEEDWEAAR